MELTRRPDLEAFLLDEMRASFSERHEQEIHVSDLESPRKAYWSRVLPKLLTDDEVGYFVAGRAHEDAVARVSGVSPGEAREIDGILLRPDFYTTIPLEFKTRRRSLAATAEEAVTRYDGYLDRVRNYCALTERPAGWLWVMGLAERQPNGTTKPEFQVFHVDFTPDELAETRAELARRRVALRTAWTTRDPSLLPLCPAWQCGKVSRVQATPPHCETCKRDFAAEWGAEKHLSAKTGAGHTMRPATYTATYEPRCKWWHECRPQDVDPTRGPMGRDETPMETTADALVEVPAF